MTKQDVINELEAAFGPLVSAEEMELLTDYSIARGTMPTKQEVAALKFAKAWAEKKAEGEVIRLKAWNLKFYQHISSQSNALKMWKQTMHKPELENEHKQWTMRCRKLEEQGEQIVRDVEGKRAAAQARIQFG